MCLLINDRRAGILGDYNRILGELQASLETMQSFFFFFFCAGEFNSDPNRGQLWNQVFNLTHDNSLELIDEDLPRNSFTYLSPVRRA